VSVEGYLGGMGLMGSDSFVHLHNHTEFSLLDGASRIRDLVGKAAALGMPAIAVTDHGVMFGALDFYQAACDAGIKPILGVEAYVAPGSRFDRERGDDDEAYRHLTLLARNEAGYRNLLRIVTDASIQGFYHRPRTDKEFLAEHADGLIALSGCLASETARLLLAGNHDRARQVVGDYRDLFGPGNFYLELQDHGIPEQRRLNPMLAELSADTGVSLAPPNHIQ
jgi:DNA polymerase-3 subunit alpha